MSEEFVEFVPDMPKGMEMPVGYRLEGVTGIGYNGRRMTRYFWVNLKTWDCGTNERDKRKAVRQAWRHSRAAATEPPQSDAQTDKE